MVRPRRGELASFFTLAFGLTWGIALALLLARPAVEAVTGPFDTASPLYFLAVYAPSLAALALTAARRGRAGLRDLVRRLDPRRVRLRDVLLVVLGATALDVVARLLEQAAAGIPLGSTVWDTMPPTTLSTLWAAPALLLLTLLLDAGPLGEELGWRGYALPRLLGTGRHPLAVAVGLGLVWGAWHLPAFFIAGTAQHDDGMAIVALIGGSTLSSVLMTWLFLRTRGNVLVAGILAHLMINVTVSDLWATVVVFALPAAAAAVSLVRGARTPVTAGTAGRDGGGWAS